MKTFVTIILAALLTLGGLATAQDATSFSDGYEVHANAFTLPITTPGAMTVKACAECASRTFQINERSEFRIDGQTVPFSVFRAAVIAHPEALLAFQTTGNGRDVLLMVGSRDLLAN